MLCFAYDVQKQPAPQWFCRPIVIAPQHSLLVQRLKAIALARLRNSQITAAARIAAPKIHVCWRLRGVGENRFATDLACLRVLHAGCGTACLRLFAGQPRPHERETILSTCGHLGGSDRALCRSVVDDHHVIANYKRSCLEAMTLLMQGSAWAKVKSLPATLTCREGLARAGYPVKGILHKLMGAR